MGQKKNIGKSGSKIISGLFNNFVFGEKVGKYGEQFISFCIDSIAKMDHRSKRFVMCDLLLSGLKHSERYSGYYDGLMQEFKKRSEEVPAESTVK